MTRLHSLLGEQGLAQLLEAVEHAPAGAVLEIGVYKGGSAQALYDLCQRQGRQLFLFDTFAGHPTNNPAEGDDPQVHPVGRFADCIDPGELQALLPEAVVVRGVFPDSLAGLTLPPVAFVHADADLYDVTLAVCEVLPPLMVPGGRLYFDDYPHAGCEGCARAVCRVFGDPEPGELLPGGQRMITLPHRRATPTTNTLTHGRYGPMLVNRHDLYVGEAFLHCGEYGACEVELLRELSRPGDVVVMAGANIGALVVPVAQQVGQDGRVLAFEPQLHPYHLLCANIALNDRWNVEAHRYAVGAARGVVRLPRLDPTKTANTGGVSVGEGNDAVPILSVDSLGLQALDLLQADVEGYELAVLQGAAETIATYKPVLYLEADRQQQRGALLTWLVEAGYHVWEHLPPLWNPHNFACATEERWPGVVSINWLCIHPDNPRAFDVDTPHLTDLWPQPFEVTATIVGA